VDLKKHIDREERLLSYKNETKQTTANKNHLKRWFLCYKFMSFEYFLILLVLFFFALFIEKKNHIHLYKSRRERFEIVTFFFLFGVIWDSFAIFRGHWIFPIEKTLGITIGVMRLEEYLFVLIIPYFILTIYKLFDSKFRKK